MSAVNGDSSFPTEMSEDERYLFDLNGYVIVRGVLTPEQVEEANAMIDKHESEMIQRSDAALRNAVKGTKLYGSGPGRKDLGQVLEWGADSKLFKSILAHPRLVPLYVTVKSTWADSNLCNVPHFARFSYFLTRKHVLIPDSMVLSGKGIEWTICLS
jgi:hypothetical protein